ncbi:MAG: DNA polymerase I [Bacteriovoracaceae bacterium]
MKKKLIVIDLSNFIFRAFYAVRMLHSPEGVPVNAVYGFLQMLIKILTTYQPTHIVIAQDTKAGGSVRKEMYADYKGNRSEPPEDLIPQFDIISTLISKLNIKKCSQPQYEADDIIGSVVTQWRNDFDELYILSGDKDLMQFVDDKVKVIDTMKDKIYGPSDVVEKMGVPPEQIVDYLSLVGDSSDNIPGVKGIGDKGAIKLLTEYGTLENCLKNADQVSNKRTSEALKNHADDALLSKKLVTIFTDLNLTCSEDEAQCNYDFGDNLKSYLASLGFKSILTRIDQLHLQVYGAKEKNEVVQASSQVLEYKKTIINSIDEIKSFFELLSQKSLFSWNIVFDQTINLNAKIIGISFCHDISEVTYIEAQDEIVIKLFFEFLSKLNSNQTVINEDAKYDLVFIYHNNIKINADFFDVKLAHFQVSPDGHHELSFIVKEYLQKDLILPDFKKKNILEMNPDEITQFTCDKAYYLFQVKPLLLQKIEELNVLKVFKEIDSPCLKILAKMEERGVSINASYFKELEKKFQLELKQIEDEIEKISNEKINLKSPKQVAVLLFEKLGLPAIKKTKTGYSTDSEVLEELAQMKMSEIPDLILKFRTLEKLLSTYVTVLPTLVNSKTHKLHTHFNLTGAATGRLSSDNPNLQNIPIKSESGKLVRKGFIATPGFLMLSADYSQVELRILSHFSNDPTMLKAFRDNVDIHAQTAAGILEIDPAEVTEEQRSKAKAVNFGLMYGQSSYGLSKTINISRNEAKEFITKYFEKFSHVKACLDSLKELCEQKGYSETLMGRKRFLPDIKSNNRTVKSFAERMSINSPIQGTAADIIKMAMIKIDNEMMKKNLASKMILQVHDELIFEVVEEEVEIMKELVQKNMESAVTLKTPLTVNISLGVNWLDLNF